MMPRRIHVHNSRGTKSLFNYGIIEIELEPTLGSDWKLNRRVHLKLLEVLTFFLATVVSPVYR
jgi:hypothetical protein